jgi:penicillin-binding protein 1A
MVNINGLEEINGENYPLDIWSLYMQGAVQKFPVQQFDTPSPDLALEVKTDGRTYVKPPPPPEPPEEESTDGETTDEPAGEDPGAAEEDDSPGIFGNDGQTFGEEPPESPAGAVTPGNRRQSGAAPESSPPPDGPRRDGRDPASPAPGSASPAAEGRR